MTHSVISNSNIFTGLSQGVPKGYIDCGIALAKYVLTIDIGPNYKFSPTISSLGSMCHYWYSTTRQLKTQ
jgi:hypothetical protein